MYSSCDIDTQIRKETKRMVRIEYFGKISPHQVLYMVNENSKFRAQSCQPLIGIKVPHTERLRYGHRNVDGPRL